MFFMGGVKYNCHFLFSPQFSNCLNLWTSPSVCHKYLEVPTSVVSSVTVDYGKLKKRTD